MLYKNDAMTHSPVSNAFHAYIQQQTTTPLFLHGDALTLLLATCPPHGIALDPFCGTGTTMKVAMMLGRKSVGIDVVQEYLEMAEQRCNSLF